MGRFSKLNLKGWYWKWKDKWRKMPSQCLILKILYDWYSFLVLNSVQEFSYLPQQSVMWCGGKCQELPSSIISVAKDSSASCLFAKSLPVQSAAVAKPENPGNWEVYWRNLKIKPLPTQELLPQPFSSTSPPRTHFAFLALGIVDLSLVIKIVPNKCVQLLSMLFIPQKHFLNIEFSVIILGIIISIFDNLFLKKLY